MAAILIIATAVFAGCNKDNKDDAPVHVTGIGLNKNELTLVVRDTAQLTVSVQPDNASNKDITWNISDVTVAVIADNGLVIAMTPGTATITATTDDGGFKAACTVTVNAANDVH